jgi:hypothetical protein
MLDMGSKKMNTKVEDLPWSRHANVDEGLGTGPLGFSNSDPPIYLPTFFIYLFFAFLLPPHFFFPSTLVSQTIRSLYNDL